MSEEIKPQNTIVDDVLPPLGIEFTQNITILMNNPIIKITKSFDGKILTILTGESKNSVTEQKDMGSVNSIKDYIERNSNENTIFLLEHDHAQWVNLSKEGFLNVTS